jgi:hypothetical protein
MGRFFPYCQAYLLSFFNKKGRVYHEKGGIYGGTKGVVYGGIFYHIALYFN